MRAYKAFSYRLLPASMLALAVGFAHGAPPSAGAPKAEPGGASSADAQRMQREIDALKAEVKRLTPDITEAMLGLQLRHARLWFAGESQDWALAAFQVHGLQDGLDGVVETYPEHAALQPERLADILPAMTKAPMKALRDAVDHKDKAAFERAYDGVSAACTGCHAVAGFTFLQIHRPRNVLLDNLSGSVPAASP